MIQTRSWLDMVDRFETNEYRDWFKFAMIWFYFNNYYNQNYRGQEKARVLAFAREYSDFYDSSFYNEDFLRDFKTKDSDGNKTYVRNMQTEAQRVYFDEEHHSCEDFFRVLYQIRCNFFHGDKQPDNRYDKELVRWAGENLLRFFRGAPLND